MAMTTVSSAAARRRETGPRRRARRVLLALLALAAMAPTAVSAGCSAGFDPPSQLQGLRVLAVTADKPYARPGDTVTFKLSYEDTYQGPGGAPRPITILWIGGCFDPVGDQYYACYGPLSQLLPKSAGSFNPKSLPPGVLELGDTFTTQLPSDIVSRRPRPASGPYYGLAYVFFLACAGDIQPVTDQGTGEAGSFPLGCFDKGRRLGADSFVPGYTQIYVFDDGRTNENPAIKDLTLDGAPLSDDPMKPTVVHPCGISEEDRRAAGCNQQDPFTSCQAHELKAVVDPHVAEPDPDATKEKLTEVVWVDYYADQGDLDSSVQLVNDALKGYIDKHEVKWIPPPDTGPATLWAVVHDARGGTAVVRRFVDVQ